MDENFKIFYEELKQEKERLAAYLTANDKKRNYFNPTKAAQIVSVKIALDVVTKLIRRIEELCSGS